MPQKQNRLRRISGEKTFSRIFNARNSASNRHLIVYALSNSLAYPRIGLSVGRKVGGAVIRNRVKRLLREAFRLEQTSLTAGYDYVFVARPAEPPSLETYRAAIRTVGEKAVIRCLASMQNDHPSHKKNTSP